MTRFAKVTENIQERFVDSKDKVWAGRTKPFPIMHVVHSLNIGGLEKIVVDLLSRLDRERFQPLVCCLKEKGSNAERLERLGIRVILEEKREGLDPSLIWRLARLLKRERVIIAHSHNPGPLLYTCLAAKLSRVPVMIHTRHARNPNRARLNRYCSYFTDKIIAASADAEALATVKERIPTTKVIRVTNGVDWREFSEGNGCLIRQNLDLNPGNIMIGTVGRLVAEKDHLTLLEALSIVRERQSRAKLILVGDGPLRAKLEEKVRQLDLKDNVIFLGQRTDVPEIMATFDIFVLSSVTEGLSVSLLEAMASGKPVVATHVGGNPEVVANGETGKIVPPRDPEKLAGAILEIISNREMAREMGRKGRERVEKEFSLDKMVERYQGLYEEILILKGILGNDPGPAGREHRQ